MIDVEEALARVIDGARAFSERKPLLIGIHTGGVWVAERLHKGLGLTEPLGTLDISFYRDDFSRVGIHPQVKTSHLPVSLDGRHIILVGDVLHTGRTIRAAMSEIFDFARPASIALAVLIVRDGRELPVQPDIAGATISLAPRQHIKLTGPDPLGIRIMEKGE